MKEISKKKLVISAVNLNEGGPLSILKECLQCLHDSPPENYEIIVLAHRKELLKEFTNFIILEFPDIKKSWIKRIVFEYKKSYRLSKDINATVWLALHDMTPNVIAEKRVVYCHNASIFYKWKLWDIYYNYKVVLFANFYRFLYSINIRKNDYVIVQQNWLRKEFARLFKIPHSNIIVSLPLQSKMSKPRKIQLSPATSDITEFFYPCFPRLFKNVELIGEATIRLQHMGITNFQITITFDGSEGNYSKDIVNKYGHIKMLKFIGLISLAEVFEHYDKADCLIFPSKLESWGLPISEFKQTGKPILVADLPYAKETVGKYDKAAFFEPQNAAQLASLMLSVIKKGNIPYFPTEETHYEQPYASNWTELFKIILKD